MNSMFKRVALVAHTASLGGRFTLISLADFLTTHGLTVLVDRDGVSHADAGRYPLVDRADLGKLADLAIVLGGDGTMLSVGVCWRHTTRPWWGQPRPAGLYDRHLTA